MWVLYSLMQCTMEDGFLSVGALSPMLILCCFVQGKFTLQAGYSEQPAIHKASA